MSLNWIDGSYEMVRYAYTAHETYSLGGESTLTGETVYPADRQPPVTSASYSGLHGKTSTRYTHAEIGRYTVTLFKAHTDHGVRDSRGRAMGHAFTIFKENDGWELRPQSTRDGVKFGALQPRQMFPTLEAAQARAEILAAQGKKAAAKKAASR